MTLSTPAQLIFKHLMKIISETNGVSLLETLKLLLSSESLKKSDPKSYEIFAEFHQKIHQFHRGDIQIEELLDHPFSEALTHFFKNFPLHFNEDHIHLTGSLGASFLTPRIQQLLNGPQGKLYEDQIKKVYGKPISKNPTVEQIDEMIRVKKDQRFEDYLKLLFLPKLVLTSRQAHSDAAYHMASELFTKFNVGRLRLKFTLARSGNSEGEVIPGVEQVSTEDVVLGLYDGFNRFKKENPKFGFILSPSFRKEADYFDSKNFKSKKEHFLHQIKSLLELIDRHPELQEVLCEVDTVGNEAEFYRKNHFNEMKTGFRKLQYRGFQIRSHHGETWRTLKRGIQAVDNAMNIWRVRTMEHGLSLGINPNVYFHRLYQRVLDLNQLGKPVKPGSLDAAEIQELDWNDHIVIAEKIMKGERLSETEQTLFVKAKFHTAREVESYQHDVINRMISKQVSLVALPSSNKKLTGYVDDFKDHPFSWWEKKGLRLGVGTDNYITLDTNYLIEMLILLYTDPQNLKITKLLMVTTGEYRRPFLSHHLWQMRKKFDRKENV